MEKPRKNEHIGSCANWGGYACTCGASDFNKGLSAMSAWIEWAVPTVEQTKAYFKTKQIWKVVIRGYYDEHLQEACLDELARDLHDGLTRKLTGKGDI